MKNRNLKNIRTIAEYHQLNGLPCPQHPMVSVVELSDIDQQKHEEIDSYIFDFYVIAIKPGFKGKMRYGQLDYDFGEGIMSFIAPGQVFSFGPDPVPALSGFLILIHPDFLWGSSLAQKIMKYEFFEYSANEALFLNEKEERIITQIRCLIQEEYLSNIDEFTHNIIIAQLELLLVYAERFYKRQFLIRQNTSHIILNQLEELINSYINSEKCTENGLPSVQYVSECLHVSPSYLSRLLKTLTGHSTQYHIHNLLIDSAKIKLSTTNKSIGEVAFELGFEHQQSFSKLFKAKTKQTPVEFRQSFL